MTEGENLMCQLLVISPVFDRVRGELLLKLLLGADKSHGSESANGIYST